MFRLGLGRLALATLVSAYLLITVGGLVSATGSGMGCGPEWPLCNGRWVPVFESPEVLLEYGHRVIAAVTTLLVLATAVFAWRERGAHSAMYRGAALSAVAVIGFEALLGAVTVFYHLPPAITTVHLATAIAFFGLITVVLTVNWVSARPDSPGNVDSFFRVAALGTVAVLYGTMLLGAYMKHTGAGLACEGFPLCNGALWPSMSTQVLLHWTHRLGGFVAAGLITVLAVRARRESPHSVISSLTTTGMVLVVAQITLGALTVFAELDPALSTAHLAVGTALFGTMTAVTAASYTVPADSGAASRVAVEVAD